MKIITNFGLKKTNKFKNKKEKLNQNNIQEKRSCKNFTNNKLKKKEN